MFKNIKYRIAVLLLKLVNKLIFNLACKTENEYDDVLVMEVDRLIIDINYALNKKIDEK